jgi:hypothetical protein
MPNFLPGVPLPLHVYRREDDGFFEPPDPENTLNRFGEVARPNNLVPPTFIWRENPNNYVAPFAACDTLNETITPDPRRWATGDLVAGYMLTYPSGSRADVRGKGLHDQDIQAWTLEMARELDTGHSGEIQDDVVFDPDADEVYHFTIAVFDGTTRDHWGSEPQVLVFGPRDESAAD